MTCSIKFYRVGRQNINIRKNTKDTHTNFNTKYAAKITTQNVTNKFNIPSSCNLFCSFWVKSNKTQTHKNFLGIYLFGIRDAAVQVP